MLRRQLRLLLILTGVLAALLAFIAFGPKPTAQEPTADELAEWTVPDDTGLPLGGDHRIVGDPTVDWYIIEELEVIPLDPSNPNGAFLLIPSEDACWMPKASTDDNPYI